MNAYPALQAWQLLFVIIYGIVYGVADNYKAICLPTTTAMFAAILCVYFTQKRTS